VPHASIGTVDLDDPVTGATQERGQSGAVGPAALDTVGDLAVLPAQLGNPAPQLGVASPADWDRGLPDDGADLVQRDRDVHVLVGVDTHDDVWTRRIGDA
jgi:hypothetical protein